MDVHHIAKGTTGTVLGLCEKKADLYFVPPANGAV
jgi:hypothetical protein